MREDVDEQLRVRVHRGNIMPVTSHAPNELTTRRPGHKGPLPRNAPSVETIPPRGYCVNLDFAQVENRQVYRNDVAHDEAPVLAGRPTAHAGGIRQPEDNLTDSEPTVKQDLTVRGDFLGRETADDLPMGPRLLHQRSLGGFHFSQFRLREKPLGPLPVFRQIFLTRAPPLLTLDPSLAVSLAQAGRRAVPLKVAPLLKLLLKEARRERMNSARNERKERDRNGAPWAKSRADLPRAECAAWLGLRRPKGRCRKTYEEGSASCGRPTRPNTAPGSRTRIVPVDGELYQLSERGTKRIGESTKMCRDGFHACRLLSYAGGASVGKGNLRFALTRPLRFYLEPRIRIPNVAHTSAPAGFAANQVDGERSAR